MATAAHIRTAAERQMANQCLFNGLAVIGATATAFTTTVAGSITVAGVMRNIAAQTNTVLAALVAGRWLRREPFRQPRIDVGAAKRASAECTGGTSSSTMVKSSGRPAVLSRSKRE